MELKLYYTPPYRRDKIIAFLEPRTIEGAELVRDGAYLRTVRTKNGAGHLRAEFSQNEDCLVLSLFGPAQEEHEHIAGRIRCLFDLDCDPQAVDAALAPLEERRPGTCVSGTRVPGCFEPFELAVRAVLGQQISVKAARTLAGRFTKAFGEKTDSGIEALEYLFPTPEAINSLGGNIADHLGPLGITAARAKTIACLAELFCRGDMELESCDAETVIGELVKLPGIGMWTAQYLAMRAIHWSDAFPHTDLGIKKALAPLGPKEILSAAEKWRPYRAYAAINLWNSY